MEKLVENGRARHIVQVILDLASQQEFNMYQE